MIDPTLRAEEVARCGDRTDVAVVLVDLVLGHGANPDPAGPLARAIRTARDLAASQGFVLPVVASVCGTDLDPQGLAGQVAVLRDAGAFIAPSAAAAARMAAALLRPTVGAGAGAEVES